MDNIKKQEFYAYDFQINFQKSPIINEKEDIFFNWKLYSTQKFINQKSYQIILYKINEQKNNYCIWDSGIIFSAKSINILYKGTSLQQESIYYCTLKVFSNNNCISEIKSNNFYTSCNWNNVKWITSRKEKKTVVFSYKNKLSGKGKIRSAIIYLSALGIYQVKINHQLLGKYDDGNQEIFYPGWTDYNELIHYQCYDITKLLHNHMFFIEALIGNGWFAGKISKNSFYDKIFNDKIKKKCFIAKIVICYEDGKKEILQTEPVNWFCKDYFHIKENDFYDGEIIDFVSCDNLKLEETIFPNFSLSLKFINQKLQPSNRCLVLRSNTDARDPVGGYIYQPGNIVNISKTLPLGEVIKKTVDIKSPILLDQVDNLIFDFGQNMAAVFTVKLETVSSKLTTVIFETGEMLNDGKTNSSVSSGGSDGSRFTLYKKNLSPPVGEKCLSRDKLLLSGINTYIYTPTFTYHGFRYINIKTTESVKILSIIQIPITSAINQTGYLKTNNKAVNQLISNTYWSQKSNYLSIPTDCPQRSERVGWTGDVQIFTPTALYNFDVISFLLNYTEIINNSSTEAQYSSIIPQSFVPSFASIYAAGWSDIGVILPWHLYRFTKNKNIIIKYFDNMHRYMQEIGPLDDIKINYNPKIFGDWLSFQPTSTNFLNLMYRAYCAKLMAQMANIIDKKIESNIYTKLYEQIKSYIQEEFVKETSDSFTLLTGAHNAINKSFHGYSFIDNAQTGLAWFLKLKIYNSEKQKNMALDALVNNIKNHKSALRKDFSEKSLSVGFLGINILLPVLASYGKMDIAYDLLLNEKMPSWLYSVKNGATTIWERWNSYSVKESFADSRMNSFNHYSYGAVLEWMYHFIAGIDCSRLPSERIFNIFPIIDSGKQYNSQQRISKFSCCYESIAGKIIVNWALKKNGNINYEIEIPTNTTGNFFLNINDKFLDYKGHCQGVLYKGIVKKSEKIVMLFQLQPGFYHILIENKNIFITEKQSV